LYCQDFSHRTTKAHMMRRLWIDAHFYSDLRQRRSRRAPHRLPT